MKLSNELSNLMAFFCRIFAMILDCWHFFSSSLGWLVGWLVRFVVQSHNDLWNSTILNLFFIKLCKLRYRCVQSRKSQIQKKTTTTTATSTAAANRKKRKVQEEVEKNTQKIAKKYTNFRKESDSEKVKQSRSSIEDASN